MEKIFFAAKRNHVFRRKSDGVVIGRFVIDTNIDNYEEVVDENPVEVRGRKNPHRPSLRRKKR